MISNTVEPVQSDTSLNRQMLKPKPNSNHDTFLIQNDLPNPKTDIDFGDKIPLKSDNYTDTD